jgi:ABC-2 type transport system ATP-binding protein
MAAIELGGVRKSYGDVVALRNLSLTVEEGEVFGFLGPNGAGKSTTIDVLLDFVRPDAGDVRVLGRDARAESVAVRRRTGVLPEGFEVTDGLTGREHVEFAIDSKDGSDDPRALLERVGVADAADRRAEGYSRGMKQRLVLAMALAGEPDLLILDEPTAGLDPNGARDLREVVRAENERGATVFFSSHILEQVEAVADRVGILRDGELVAEDSIEALRGTVAGDGAVTVETGGVTDAAVAAAEAVDGVSRVSVDGDEVSVSCDADAKYPALRALAENGVVVRDFTTQEQSLEDLFAAYTGGDTDADAASPPGGARPAEAGGVESERGQGQGREQERERGAAE